MNTEVNPLNNIPDELNNKPVMQQDSFNLGSGEPVFDQAKIDKRLDTLRLNTEYIPEYTPEQIEKMFKRTGNIYFRSALETTVTMGIKETMAAVYEANKVKGFWDEKRNFGEMLMLITSELAEALEADRASKQADVTSFKAELKEFNIGDDLQFDTNFEKEVYNAVFKKYIKDSVSDELADAVIRLFDISAGLGIDLEFHIRAKMKYNSLRPYKHGKKY